MHGNPDALKDIIRTVTDPKANVVGPPLIIVWCPGEPPRRRIKVCSMRQVRGGKGQSVVLSVRSGYGEGQ